MKKLFTDLLLNIGKEFTIIECDHDLLYDSKDASNDLIKSDYPMRSK